MIVPFELIPYMWPVIKILTEDESPMIEDLRFDHFPEHFSPGVSAHDRFERTYSKLFILSYFRRQRELETKALVNVRRSDHGKRSLAEKGLQAKFYRRIVTASHCSIFGSIAAGEKLKFQISTVGLNGVASLSSIISRKDLYKPLRYKRQIEYD
jgi:hypothetical protein